MNAVMDLLSQLKASGIRLGLDSKQDLIIRGNKEALTPELVAALKSAKSELVSYLKNNEKAEPNAQIKPVAERDNLPLSFSQQRLWLLDQLEGPGSHYNMAQGLKIDGPLQTELLNQAFSILLERQHSLRTSFFSDENGNPRLYLRPVEEFCLAHYDLSEETHQDQGLRQIETEQVQGTFDLQRDFMLRSALVKLGPQQHILYVTLHHIASDGWSMTVLVKEFLSVYSALVKGESNPLPPLPIQYADYAAWQRQWLQGERLEKLLSYWQHQLEDLPLVHNLPLDHPRSAMQTFTGGVHQQQLSSPLKDQLNRVCQQHDATLFMGLHATLAVLMARYSHESDIVIGTPIANREQEQVADIIGFFANTLVLRADLSQRPNFATLLQQSRDNLYQAYAHQQAPFEQVVERLNPERSANYTPLFQVMLVLQNNEQAAFALDGLTLEPMTLSSQDAKFDLTLYVSENQAGLALHWEYNADLFEPESIARMGQHFENLLKQLTAQPDVSVYQLDYLTEAERRQQLVEWNQTQAPYSRDLLLHQLVEQHALATPEKLAVVVGEAHTSYGQLNAKANQLAQYLCQNRQVKAGDLVGICLPRSLDSLVSMLAILKLGAAYVPLAANNPAKRLAYMLTDAKLTTVLTHLELLQTTPVSAAQGVCLDDKQVQSELAKCSEDYVASSTVNAEQVAYVIYTSGSTGKPKGVRGSHRAMVNRVEWMNQYIPPVAQDVFCHKTSLAFVDHVAEVFQPFSLGKHLVVLSDQQVGDLPSLLEAVDQHGISRITLVPSLLRVLLESLSDPNALPSLRCVISSGEALTMDVAKAFQQKLPDVTLYNIYGSTEVGADVLAYELRHGDLDLSLLQHFLDQDAPLNGPTNSAASLDASSVAPRLGADVKGLSKQFSSTDMPLVAARFSDYLHELKTSVLPGTVDVTADTFVGHMTSKLPNFMPEISKLIAQLNQNLVKIETSGSMSLIERQVISTMHKLFYNFDNQYYDAFSQDPHHVFGLVTSGGSLSNVTALLYARNNGLIKAGIAKQDLDKHGLNWALQQKGYQRMVILGSRLLHYSMKKTVSLFGIGQANLLAIEQDEEQRMSIKHLEQTIKYCQDNNIYIAAVIGIAGATETGTLDPLEEIAEVTRRHKLHFHVDAAWGGAFQFSNKYQYKLRGIEQADSITLCPHKQLYLPQGISLCLFKDTASLQAIATHANYQAQPGSFDMGQYTLEGSRPANALLLHASLHLISKPGYGRLVEQSMEKTAYFVKLIQASNCFEIVGAIPDLNIINYRYVPSDLRGIDRSEQPYTLAELERLNDAVEVIQQEQFRAGRSFVSKTTLFLDKHGVNGSRVFRVVLSNPLTEFNSLQAVLQDQMRIAQECFEPEHLQGVNGFTQLASPDQKGLDKWLIPVGKPLANAQVYLLDEQLKLLPVGVTGELYVSGDCLAIDYLDQPEMTAKAFITSPFDPNQRLYKTGDQMRWRADGSLEFIGRNDHQVKIRGCRIELGEIEETLLLHPQVTQVHVITKTDPDRILAYLVSAQGDTAQHGELIEQAKQLVATHLPDYMMPAGFIVLPALPLNPNGKIDRQALPEVELVGSSTQQVAPTNELQTQLCQVWQDVLGVESIGIEDNFFALGGDSLTLIKLAAKLSNLGFSVKAQDIHRQQTIAKLETVIKQNNLVDLTQLSGEAEAAIPLLPSIHEMFEFAEGEGANGDINHWNGNIILEFKTGALDIPRVNQTINLLLKYHSILRARMSKAQATAQLTISEHQAYGLTEYDLAGFQASKADKLKQLVAQLQLTINLANNPFQVALLNFGEGDHSYLVITIHHSLIDGFSCEVLRNDFFAVYQQLTQGETPRLPAADISYTQYANALLAYANSPALQAELNAIAQANWQQAKPLPTDFDGANLVASNQGLEISLSVAQTQGLQQALAQLDNVSLRSAIASALVKTVAHFSQSPYVNLDIQRHGRRDQELGKNLSRLVGYFSDVYTTPFHCQAELSDAASMQALSAQFTNASVQFKSLPLLRYLNQTAQAKQVMANIPRADIALNLLDDVDSLEPAETGLVRLVDYDEVNHHAIWRDNRLSRKWKLYVLAHVVAGELKVTFSYSDTLYKKETIVTLADHFLNELTRLSKD
ncbi:aminotransferase class V-fold PLP-dependent enzyme [Motilimonas eburnea]|uniref:aminotransferase class V-fold PLP-dependent enzyme n=1 Tax=Motilimonas eburnea TaxID=1737488 RepID=UPI001E4D6B94|nr:aminotransferase class V-fold PLP-dependent enzyme [Motilimonas eburnea]MCE2573781.1 aminotransferase class V-fold PLP-dependent enzyme [Motilimonas eburnea]